MTGDWVLILPRCKCTGDQIPAFWNKSWARATRLRLGRNQHVNTNLPWTNPNVQLLWRQCPTVAAIGLVCVTNHAARRMALCMHAKEMWKNWNGRSSYFLPGFTRGSSRCILHSPGPCMQSPSPSRPTAKHVLKAYYSQYLTCNPPLDRRINT
jgi:hypothetical protein